LEEAQQTHLDWESLSCYRADVAPPETGVRDELGKDIKNAKHRNVLKEVVPWRRPTYLGNAA